MSFSLRITLPVLLSLVASTAFAGTTYYVRPGGSDSNCSGLADANDPGSGTVPRACAFASPQGCVNKMHGTDDCLIHAGTYTKTCPSGLNWSTAAFDFSGINGTSSDYTVIKAYPGEKPLLCAGSGTCDTNPNCASVGVFAGTSYVRFEGLSVQGYLRVGRPGTQWGTHHVTVTGNDLTGGGVCDGNYAMLRIEETQAVTADHNHIHDQMAGSCSSSANGHWDGIKLYGAQDTVIEYNTIERGGGNALTHFIDDKDCPMNNIYRYNAFKDGYLRWDDQAAHCRPGAVLGGIEFYGNTIQGVGGAASYLWFEGGNGSAGALDLGIINVHHNTMDMAAPFCSDSGTAALAPGVFIFKDNLIYRSNDSGAANGKYNCSRWWPTRAAWNMDYNRYSTLGNYYGGGTLYGTTSAWSTALGGTNETHSLEANPPCAVVDATNGDWHLQTGSPCLTASSTGGQVGAYGVTSCVGYACGSGAVCGNGAVEAGEQCDGTNLAGQTCATQGFSGGTLSCSASCTFNTSACTVAPPAAPSGLTATAASYSQVNLSWTDNSNNESGFRVERKTGSTGAYTEIGTTATNVRTYSDMTVNGSTTYFYRVRAYNTGGNSAYSAEASATTPVAPGINTGMVGYWTFDEASGTVASDGSGNGNNGTLTSGPIWTSGKIGGGISFDGIASYVVVPDAPSLDIAGSGSISVWVKRNALSTGDWRAIVAKGNDNVNAHYNYGMEFSSTDHMEIDIGGGSTGTKVADTIISQTDLANWHQHGVVWNGSLITYYYDGLPVGVGWSQVAPSAGNTSSLFFGTFGNGGDFLNAVVDDLRIYNRALTPADMSTLFANATATIPPPDVTNLNRTDVH